MTLLERLQRLRDGNVWLMSFPVCEVEEMDNERLLAHFAEIFPYFVDEKKMPIQKEDRQLGN